MRILFRREAGIYADKHPPPASPLLRWPFKAADHLTPGATWDVRRLTWCVLSWCMLVDPLTPPPRCNPWWIPLRWYVLWALFSFYFPGQFSHPTGRALSMTGNQVRDRRGVGGGSRSVEGRCYWQLPGDIACMPAMPNSAISCTWRRMAFLFLSEFCLTSWIISR